MPRVGSSRITTFGFMHSQRASMTFCWLPPESSFMGWSGLDALMPSLRMNRSTISSCAFSETSPTRERRGRAAATMFSLTERSGMIPSDFRSSGRNAMPALMAEAGEFRFTSLPSTRTVPESSGWAPKMAFAVSVRPAPRRPASPTTSPGRTSKETPSSMCRRVRPSAASTGSPEAARCSLSCVVPPSTSESSRPSILEISSSRESSARSPVWMTLPSRKTVTLSQIS